MTTSAPRLPARLERLLAPQERYDAFHQLWWRRHGGRGCDLAYANSYDPPNEAVMAAIASTLTQSPPPHLQYTPYGGATLPRRLIAEQLTETQGVSFSWKGVVLTPGAMSALHLAFRLLGENASGPGEVIVPTPCWLDYPLYLEQEGLRAVLVPLRPPGFRLDVDAIAAAITPATRAVLLSQPANPTGLMYSEEELDALSAVLRAAPSRPVLISDECHREIVYSPARFIPPARHHDNTWVIHSFGKTLLMQGQRIGYIAVPDSVQDAPAIAVDLSRLSRAMGYCTPTALMQAALPRLLTLRPQMEVFARRRAKVTAALREAGCAYVEAPATFFLYVESPWADEFTLVERLGEAGVFVLPASVFHHHGWVRLSLTASDEMIDRSLAVLRTIPASTTARH